MAKVKNLALELHELQVTEGKEKRKLKSNMSRIKSLRNTLDLALDKCEGSIESVGYITDDEMDFLKSTNRDLVEVSLNRNDNINIIRTAHDTINKIKLSMKEVNNG